MTRDSTEVDPDHPRDRVGRAGLRRHLVALAIAVLGIVVGSTLVLTGRDTGTRTSQQPAAPGTTIPPTPLDGLGTVDDIAGAEELLRRLDPRDLTAGHEAPIDDWRADDRPERSDAGVQRCSQAVVQQTPDRSLGERLDAAALVVGSERTYVLSHALPASGDQPSGVRIVLVDALTCRVLAAVER